MRQPQATSIQSASEFLNAPGEMAQLIRNTNWTETPLGAPASWPQSLRTSINICLGSHFPMLLWWRAELVMFYNDACIPLLGPAKHPAAMGQQGCEGWEDAWHIIGPMLEDAIKEGRATWSENQRLPLERNGYVEECFFTFSCSPICDESGDIGGALCTLTETTEQVIFTRRLRILNELAAYASSAGTQAQALALAANTMSFHGADIPFGLIYRLDHGSNTALLEASSNIQPGTRFSPERIDLSASEAAWPLASVTASGQKPYLLLEHLGEEYGILPGGMWPEQPRQVLILPLRHVQKDISGFFVAGISPRRAFDEPYHAFLRLVADQLANALTRAAAYESERKQTEVRAEIDRAKTDFFANISHEFRTPLTLILAPLENAYAFREPVLRGKDLTVLYLNALRLLKLVNTLLDFSRLDAARFKASYSPGDLAAMTADLAGMLRSAIERAGLTLNIHCPPLAEPVYIDREMWEKIVLNLLSNAFKFTFEGEISVSLLQVGAEVELAVRDTGTGIAAEELPYLFTRFHRIEQARSRTREGIGLGNALVKNLVELHGGAIGVESQLGQGTTFRVRIPLGKKHLPQDQIEEKSILASSSPGANAYVQEILRWLPGQSEGEEAIGYLPSVSSTSAVPCPGDGTDLTKKILIVNANADMRQFLTKLLCPCWQVHAVADGAAALVAAMASPPDLVLTDNMMPEMNGLELLERLRDSQKNHRIPIIVICAYAGEEACIEGVNPGADDYIVKPFSTKELVTKIATHLRLAQARQEMERATLENEKRLRAYVQASSDIIYRMSPDWQELKMLSGHGFLTDTLASNEKWLETYIHADDHLSVLATINEAIQKKQIFEMEHQVFRVDGTLGWVYSRAVPVLDEHDQIIEWFGAARDVTKRKNKEQELQENAAKFITILEQLPVGLGVVDQFGRLILRNAIMKSYMNDILSSMDDMHRGRIQFFDAQDNLIPQEEWPARQALRGVAVYGMEGCYTDDNENLLWHLVSGVPLVADHNKFAGAIVVIQDITAQKKTEQELRQFNEHLDLLVKQRTAAAEEKTEQLRSLTAQLIEAEENGRRKFAELLHDDLQQIIGAAHVQMQALAETTPEIPSLTDIGSLLQDAIDKTRFLSNEISPPVLYHADLAGGLQWLAARMSEQFHLAVTIDIAKKPETDNASIKRFVFRAAQELLFNIVKHSGTKRAHLGLTESSNDIILVVSDEGQGFDPAVLGGAKTGFGLMTIQERARYMGGRVDIQSAPGKGSRFTLTLPLPDKNTKIVYRRRASDRINDPAANMSETAQSMKRILVVDDHHLMRRGLINLLHSQPGIQVVGEAANGQEALDQTRILHPDVVLMDISMPVIGGIEATKLLKKEFPAVRVIGLSMHQDQIISEHMHSAGAEITLTKTAGANELIKAIQGSQE